MNDLIAAKQELKKALNEIVRKKVNFDEIDVIRESREIVRE